ncbi:hypothetical protein HZB94_03160 [Candidatus Falkowbacteria bacterium]|nr:hypothetical protein [Candidatus Falkowbacteria bacterium]
MESLPSVKCLLAIICVLFGVRIAADVSAQEAKVPKVPAGRAEGVVAPEAPDVPRADVISPLPAEKAPMRVICEVNPLDETSFICHMAEKDEMSCVFYESCILRLMRALKPGEACPGYFVCTSVRKYEPQKK